MTWTETLRTGWSAIRTHVMRSTLTVLGILIGIAAVILTVGLGLGTQQDVSAQISALGSNLLIVRPGSSTDASGMRGGFGTGTTLTRADAEALASDVNAPDVSGVAAEKSSGASVEGNVPGARARLRSRVSRSPPKSLRLARRSGPSRRSSTTVTFGLSL